MRASAIAATAMMAMTTATAVLIPAATSEAGVYHYYACRVPHGAEAGRAVAVAESPTPNEYGAWSHSSKGTGADGNQCVGSHEPSRSALIAALPAGENTSGDFATWEFSAPAGEAIREATLWRAGDTEGGEGYVFWLATPDDPSALETFGSEDTFDGCNSTFGSAVCGTTTDPLSSENEVTVPEAQLGGSHLYLNASCSRASCEGTGEDEHGYAVVVYLYAADLLLEETSAPSVSGQTGALAVASTVSGEAGLSFDAQDEGSGVYQETMKVDGKTVAKQVIDEEEGSCKPFEVATDGHFAFLSAKPCPASVEGRLSLNTATLGNGEHEVLVTVDNAAGVEAPVLDRTIDVANGTPQAPPGSGGGGAGNGGGGSGTSGSGGTGASGAGTGSSGGGTGASGKATNGVNASAEARLAAWWAPPKGRKPHSSRKALRHEAKLVARFARSGEIQGILRTLTGKPIGHAELQVLYTPSFGGAKQRRMGSVRTNAKGRFVMKLRKGLSSRSISIEYSSALGGRPVTSAALMLGVRAGVTLRVSPKRTSVGHMISLSGRVLGGPLPTGGKQVVLQARSKGSKWMPFEVLSTDRHGRFHGTHRFRLAGPVHYEFRAVCPHEADFPFLAGTSKLVGVFES